MQAARKTSSGILLRRFFAVLLAALLLLVAFRWAIADIADMVAERGYVSARLEQASRFEKEFHQLFDAAEAFTAGAPDVSRDAVKLRLDLLWSRTRTLASDDYHVTYGQLGVDNAVVAKLHAALPLFDAAVARLRAGDPASMAALRAIERRFDGPLGKFGDAAAAARNRRIMAAMSTQNGAIEKLGTLQDAVVVFGALVLVLLFVELNRQRQLVEKLNAASEHNHRLASNDHLTGLLNRRAFEHLLGERLAACRGPLSLLILDLNGFKPVNDTNGHAAGDQLLKQVGERLTDAAEGHAVARIGGDEFAIVAEIGEASVETLCRAILATIARPFDLGEVEARITTSIGYAAAEPGITADELLRRADGALYLAKAERGGCFRHFDTAMAAEIDRTRAIESELASALDAGDLAIVLQPHFSVRTRQITGAEALLRWDHPVHGAVPPARIVEFAARTGRSAQLDLAVLDRSCEAAATLRPLKPGFRVSVNISPLFARQPGFPTAIGAVLKRHGLGYGDIVLEFTEAAVMGDFTAIADNLAILKARGMALAIDDFGRGHSNLTRLARIPFTQMKIDKSLIDAIAEDERAAVVLDGITRLARALELEIVVEGVETAAQLRALSSFGELQVQGYLLGRPMHPLALTSLMQAVTPAFPAIVPTQARPA